MSEPSSRTTENISDPTSPMANYDWSTRSCCVSMAKDTYEREMEEFEVKDDDVYMVGFPKSGTTWMQEIIWLLRNNLDFDTAKKVNLSDRSANLEFSALFPRTKRNTMELARNAASPRVIKSHLPARLLPKQIWEKRSKIVYCCRNPKDNAVSYFHFARDLGHWEDTIDAFVQHLINSKLPFTPYWDHVMDFWQMRHADNIFFTTYEAMKRDLRKVLIDLNRFFDNTDLSEEILLKLEDHLSFDQMKANPHTNPTSYIKTGGFGPEAAGLKTDFQFMRRGIVGSFKDELSQETQDKLDKWIEANLAKYDLKLQDIFGEL